MNIVSQAFVALSGDPLVAGFLEGRIVVRRHHERLSWLRWIPRPSRIAKASPPPASPTRVTAVVTSFSQAPPNCMQRIQKAQPNIFFLWITRDERIGRKLIVHCQLCDASLVIELLCVTSTAYATHSFGTAKIVGK